MTTRDSGFIDLFAVHEEAKAASVPAPLPSAPPPGVSFDVAGDDEDDIDVFAAAQRQSQKRMKLIGGGLAGVGVIGALVLLLSGGGEPKAAPQAAAVAAPPPVAAAAILEPARAPVPAPVPSAPVAEKKGKADYTRATAAAAYAAASNKKKPARAAKVGGIKLQKVQSSGTGS